MRNLTQPETVVVITAFGKRLQGIRINGKPLVTGSDEKTIVMNKELSLDEIKQQFPVPEDNILAIVRQLYIRLMSSVIQEKIGGDIANIPTVSFIENNGLIQLNY